MKTRDIAFPRHTVILALYASLLLAPPVISTANAATNGQWDATTGGNWNDSSKWLNGNIADGADATATFDTAITGTTFVTIDAGRTIGHLVLDSAQQWNFSGQALTLAVSDHQSGGPTITVTRGYQYFASGIAGTQGFTKLGNGHLYLAGNNTYTGVTYINTGHVYLRHSNALGAIGGGNGTIVTRTDSATPQLHLLNNITTNEDITLRHTAAGAATTFKNDANANTLGGTLTLERAGTGATSDIYTFGVEVTQGSLTLAGNITGKLADGATAGTPGTDANRLQINTVAQATRTTANITGIISDGTIGGGGLSLYKTGTGILRLSAANTYTGSTVHTAGLLLVNNTTGSGTGAGSVSVNATATLGGIGTIAPEGTANITIDSNATVSPGDTDDTGASTTAGQKLTFDLANTTGNATFSNGALLAFDFNATTNKIDSLAFIGLTADDTTQVQFNNNTINFASIAGGVLADGLYTLISFDSTNAYSGQLVIGTGLEAYTSTLIYNAGSIQLQIGTSIPEPATLAILAGLAGLGSALAFRRRNHLR